MIKSISVSRTPGRGLKEPNRIFDPFYTTKSVGKGTGLGLSICYGIVKEHCGEISARKASGGGAIIEICLPSAGQASEAASNSAPLPVREFALSGRILLAEGEEAILEFERDVLVGAGAQVTTVLNGEQLKQQLLTHSFDAIITDGKMILAGMFSKSTGGSQNNIREPRSICSSHS